MKTIRKQIAIDAPKENVWTVLLDDNYTADWYAIFCEGTTAQSDWIEGHRIAFTDKTNNGIFGIIARKKPYEKLSFVYHGLIINGNDDTESPMAKMYKDAEETYRLTEEDGHTVLAISCDMDESMYEEMSSKWEAALQRISELAAAV